MIDYKNKINGGILLNKSNRYIMLLTAVFLLMSVIFNDSTKAEGIRYSGADRFEVAVNISKSGWPSGASTVILSNYNAYADALTAGPLAKQLDAPILLTHQDSLTPKTREQIVALHPQRVIIVGGEGSVSQTVKAQLESELGIPTVDRISGADRFEVSKNIASLLNSDTAFITYGLNFSDALAISPYASQIGAPILLSKKDDLTPPTREALAGKSKSYIIGGTGSISQGIESQLPSPQRIGGKDRFEVSANIIRTFNLPTNKVFVATGLTFADALTGSVLAAKDQAPLLLSHPTSVPQSIRNLVLERNISNYVILGGPASVPDTIVSQMFSKLALAGKRIMLDPGHGGSQDPGASHHGYIEKNLNSQFALKFGKELSNRGATVIYTRDPNKDVYLSLEDRANLANSSSIDLFISLHHDGSVDTNAKGLSTHYSSYRPGIETQDVYVISYGKRYGFVREDTPNKSFIVLDGGAQRSISYMGQTIAYDTISPSQAAVESKTLAKLFGETLTTSQITNRGFVDQNFYVARWTKMPSVLIELGFVSNKQEVSILANPNVQQERAVKLAQTIENYYK
jgi:N-acetylmuramoyl-L-alanine amidase